jgi:hypothetical protein
MERKGLNALKERANNFLLKERKTANNGVSAEELRSRIEANKQAEIRREICKAMALKYRIPAA